MEWNPEDYAKNSSGQLVWARELILRLVLKGNESILDVGCGDGKVTAELAAKVPEGRVAGVDSSPAFVKYARDHYGDRPNLRFETMDARRLEGNAAFDIVFSNAVLHWVDDHPSFLAGCARVLKANGRLMLSCAGKGSAADMSAAMEETMVQPRWAGYFTSFAAPYFYYSPTEYRDWLPEAGFDPVRLALVEKDLVHEGREGLAGWLRTTWMPYTRYLPQGSAEDFVMETVDRYLERHPLDGSGRTHVRMVRLEAEARLVRHG